ncbi:MAG: carboxypeptidase regulatory-like domain-containing protein [Myxococcales bacterium]|nr:carboxypeptidase regulatory-like domain-containing protein [Myxococcales bacterium]
MTHRSCPECEAALVCREHGAVQRPLVAPCPNKRGGLWVSVHDAKGQEVPGVVVEVAGRTAVTDATGLAAFDPLADGSYTAKLGELPPSMAERYHPPAEPRIAGIAVSKGKIAFAELVLRRLPTLKVELSKALAAKVTLQQHGGGEPRSKSTKDGTADFGTVPVGTHTVQVELEARAEGQQVEQVEQTNVTTDYDDDVIVPLEVRSRANPVIEPERDAVAVDADRLRVVLRADGPFQGSGRLTITAGSQHVQVLRNGQVEGLTQDALTIPDLDQAGVTVELEARSASAYEGVTLQWELLGGEVGPPTSTTITAVEATLVIHDPQGNPLDRQAAQGQGRVLVHGRAAGRRARVTVSCEPAEYPGTLQLLDPHDGNHLQLYQDATGGEMLILPHNLRAPPAPTEGQRTPRVWPVELYVEGIEPSEAAGRDQLDLEIQDLGRADWVRLTVVEATLEVCGPRPEEGEPTPLVEADKLEPGRRLAAQNWSFTNPRALVRVHKRPLDAPCALRLVASQPELRLLPNETRPKDGETAHVLPMTIAAGQITDAAQGLVLWAELDGQTPDEAKVTLQLEVEDLLAEPVDEVGFAVDLATVEIEVARHDEESLSADVRVELRNQPDGTVLLQGLVPAAAGKVELRVPPASYAVNLVAGPGSDEEPLRLLRDPLEVSPTETEKAESEASAKAAAETEAREAAVRVSTEKPTRVRYTYAKPYEHIQLISYQIRTGAYLGTDDVERSDYPDDATWEAARKTASEDDIEARCQIMQQIVAHAHQQAAIDSRPTTLKLFMAPEFYFRGRRGAYPIEMLSKIPEQLRQETDKPKYADWMFVFGSAIGRVLHPEREARAGTQVQVDESVAIFSFECKKGSRLAAVNDGWEAQLSSTGATFFALSSWSKLGKKTQNYGTATVCGVYTKELSPTKIQVTLVCRGVPEFPRTDFKLSIKDPLGVKAERVPSPKVERCYVQLRTRCAQAPAPGWWVEQNEAFRGIVEHVEPVEPGVFWLSIDRASDALPRSGIDLELAAEPRAEIFNVAFVQQGGKATSMKPGGGREHRELLVYKETISWIDFEGVDYGKEEFFTVLRHRAEIDGESTVLLPTAGSTDLLGGLANEPGQRRRVPPNAASTNTSSKNEEWATEQSASGLGGGSVFTMHGITFGLEVCLDHASRRLAKYYGGIAKPGEPKVQVHLIPSCGMSIENPCCVPDGLVFNVDRSHSEARNEGGAKGAGIAAKWHAEAPPPAGVELGDYFGDPGLVHIYPELPTPTPAVV